MSNFSDWLHDDITWCAAEECPHTECYRHLANKHAKEGYFSMANFKGTEDCLFPEQKIEKPKKKSAQALAEEIDSRLKSAEEIHSNFITLPIEDAKAIYENIWPVIMPGPLEPEGEMKALLENQTAEQRLQFCRDIIFDWDGFCTAKHLGELINEVYGWMRVPYKGE